MEQRFIEIDSTHEDFMLYLFFCRGILGDIQTDEQKIQLITRLMQNFFSNVGEDVIKMCSNWYLETIKTNTELCDSEIMYELGKGVYKEIKGRWL